VLDRGIGHVYIRPATPRLNGKVERSHRIDADEFYRLLEGVVIDDSGLFAERLREWENFYNFDRPHGGLGGQTPYERLRQKTQSPVCDRPSSVAQLGEGRVQEAVRGSAIGYRRGRQTHPPSRAVFLARSSRPVPGAPLARSSRANPTAERRSNQRPDLVRSASWASAAPGAVGGRAAEPRL
jgi:hypothetical protein